MKVREEILILHNDQHLPRKFKVGLAVPEDNTIDVLTNDLAIVSLFEADRLTGYNFLLGGGHGMTHNKPETYPRLATEVAFIDPDDLLDAAAAVVRRIAIGATAAIAGTPGSNTSSRSLPGRICDAPPR
jgi:sulfite reductase beta subunit-like hemoprotein